jgi:hypothetical protein
MLILRAKPEKSIAIRLKVREEPRTKPKSRLTSKGN